MIDLSMNQAFQHLLPSKQEAEIDWMTWEVPCQRWHVRCYAEDHSKILTSFQTNNIYFWSELKCTSCFICITWIYFIFFWKQPLNEKKWEWQHNPNRVLCCRNLHSSSIRSFMAVAQCSMLFCTARPLPVVHPLSLHWKICKKRQWGVVDKGREGDLRCRDQDREEGRDPALITSTK